MRPRCVLQSLQLDGGGRGLPAEGVGQLAEVAQAAHADAQLVQGGVLEPVAEGFDRRQHRRRPARPGSRAAAGGRRRRRPRAGRGPPQVAAQERDLEVEQRVRHPRAAAGPRRPHPAAEERPSGVAATSRRSAEQRHPHVEVAARPRRARHLPQDARLRRTRRPSGLRASRGRATRSRRAATRIWCRSPPRPRPGPGAAGGTRRGCAAAAAGWRGRGRRDGVVFGSGLPYASASQCACFLGKGPDPNISPRPRVTASSRWRNTMAGMTIAAIDLGSNSLHMVLVETVRAGAFRVIGTEKEMVRLGARTLSRGQLSAAAMKRAARRPAQVQAAGGERGGGQDPRRRHLRRPRGRQRRGLPGARRPRARHLAARDLRRRGGAAHLPGRPPQHPPRGPARPGGRHRRRQRRAGAGRRGRPGARASREKIGVLRLTEDFVKSDPLSTRDEARLVKHVDDGARAPRGAASAPPASTPSSAPPAPSSPWAPSPSSAGARRAGHRCTTSPCPRTRSTPLGSGWSSTDLKARLKIPGLDESRADIIVPGAVLLDTILQRARRAGADPVRMGAARGDPARLHPRPPALGGAGGDLPRRAAAQRGQPGRALRLRREARAQGGRARPGPVRRHRPAARPGRGPSASLLEYAALLHGIGHHISYREPPQAHLLPHQERRPPRLHAAWRWRCWRTWPATTAGPPAQEAPGVRRAAARPSGARCRCCPRICAWPTPSTAATARW